MPKKNKEPEKINKEKYQTWGVQKEIPVWLQCELWQVREIVSKKITLDYLQVFKLKPVECEGKIMQLIEYSQEQPQYTYETIILCDTPITEKKVWIIDDDDYSTMLLPNEY